MILNSATLGAVIILSSISGGILFCLFICTFLWIRHKRESFNSCFSFAYQRQKKKDESKPEFTLNPACGFPTISNSEPGSEVCSPITSLSSSSPLSPFGLGSKPNFRTFPKSEILNSNDSFKESSTALPKTFGLKRGGLSTSLSTRAVRPSSLYLGDITKSGSQYPSHVQRSIYKSSLRSLESSPMRFSPSELKTFMSDTDESLSSSPQVLISSQENDSRLCIGHVKIRVRYYFIKRCLQIDLVRNYELPPRLNLTDAQLYTKLILISGNRRLRRSKKINSDHSHCTLASFDQEITYQDLIRASIIISLCKNLDYADQGMLIGSASTSFENLGIKDHFGLDFDSNVIEIPLYDSTPHQLVNCGGTLHLSVEYYQELNELLLNNVLISDIDLTSVTFKGQGEIYLKISVHEDNKGLCWRRTLPVLVSSDSSEVILTNRIYLPIAVQTLEKLQTILSIRLKTGKRGDRRIIGNVNLSDYWNTSENILEDPSNENKVWKLDLEIPL